MRSRILEFLKLLLCIICTAITGYVVYCIYQTVVESYKCWGFILTGIYIAFQIMIILYATMNLLMMWMNIDFKKLKNEKA